MGGEVTVFHCPICDSKELQVNIIFADDNVIDVTCTACQWRYLITSKKCKCGYGASFQLVGEGGPSPAARCDRCGEYTPLVSVHELKGGEDGGENELPPVW